MKKYTFDATLLASFTVDATDRDAAETILRDCLGLGNFGAWPNGDPILAEVEIEGELDHFDDEDDEL
jgi:hypothetical protein